MILRNLIGKEECSENDHFLNTKILKKYSSFYVLLFDSCPQLEIIDFLNNFCDNICINTVYHKHNYEDIANIFKIISQFRGVKKWQVFEYMGIGIQIIL